AHGAAAALEARPRSRRVARLCPASPRRARSALANLVPALQRVLVHAGVDQTLPLGYLFALQHPDLGHELVLVADVLPLEDWREHLPLHRDALDLYRDLQGLRHQGRGALEVAPDEVHAAEYGVDRFLHLIRMLLQERGRHPHEIALVLRPDVPRQPEHVPDLLELQLGGPGLPDGNRVYLAPLQRDLEPLRARHLDDADCGELNLRVLQRLPDQYVGDRPLDGNPDRLALEVLDPLDLRPGRQHAAALERDAHHALDREAAGDGDHAGRAHPAHVEILRRQSLDERCAGDQALAVWLDAGLLEPPLVSRHVTGAVVVTGDEPHADPGLRRRPARHGKGARCGETEAAGGALQERPPAEGLSMLPTAVITHGLVLQRSAAAHRRLAPR